MIALQGIGKSFKVAKRSAGLRQAVKALFVREHTIVEALHQISFTIREGEIVGYIGPNGAGKSTTIKVMSGILVPDQGSCSIMGYTPWKERTEYVKHIGVVFGQRSQLWWDVPVLDSFELLRDIYKVPAAEYKANLELLTGTLDLQSLLQTPVRQLSLGQRMRCEIAASLLHGPKILFLDEPTIGLDAVSKIAVRQFIKTINQEKGVTVILTTHDMSDIEALADRILMIGKGSAAVRRLADRAARPVRNAADHYRRLRWACSAGRYSGSGAALLVAGKGGLPRRYRPGSGRPRHLPSVRAGRTRRCRRRDEAGRRADPGAV
ncbi:ATP-binding cassette domain-containing protein [Paenibacillus sp. P26]|nr:ATP-binding cassette domain-containing protein [Paenibacillus sp. P26]